MHPDLLRYSCQMNLPGFSEATQQRLLQANVFIAGAGGLGCPAAQYLAASGIGSLTICDYDTVSIGNLHRQILFTPAEVGQKKAVTAAGKLQAQNPLIRITALDEKITSENVLQRISGADIVIDCTDNFETRYLLNDACVLLGKPLVYGAIYQYDGQVAVWNVENKDGTRSPNYRDVFPEVDASQVPNCAEGGVIPTLAGIIGCMQANEVIKYITGIGELLAGKILVLDAQTLQSRIIRIGNTTTATITGIATTQVIPSIAVHALKTLLEDETVELIDVRNDSERAQFSIGGKHLPVTTLREQLHLVDTTKTVVFYCASGKRSGEAVRILLQHYANATALSLEGGIKAWREAGLGEY